jgi:thioesterase domain-containing protein
MTKSELEQRIRNGIPITSHMDFRVLTLTDERISVVGGAQENHNVHGTAFAGSLYAVATLAAWGLVQSRLPENAELVMTSGEIVYRKPVLGEIIADCHIDQHQFKDFLTKLQRKGKARLDAVSLIPYEQGTAVEFRGVLFARLP